MYSTQKNLSLKKPELFENAVCGRHLLFPDETGRRKAEGGLRTNGQYKRSLERKPLISIITVVFNGEKLLERCIVSVLEQDYDNIEYIVIDGGSDDGTVDIIRKYESAIDYYISEPDQGIYNAMNKGLALACGQYIAILNSDDWYALNMMQCYMKEQKVGNFDVMCSHAIFVDLNNEKKLRKKSFLWDESMFILGIPCPHETILAKRECYEATGPYDERFRIASDYLWVQKLYLNKLKVKIVEMDFLFMGIGGASFNKQLEYIENIDLMRFAFNKDKLTDFDLAQLYQLKSYVNTQGSSLEKIKNVVLTHPRSSFFMNALAKTLLIKYAESKLDVKFKIRQELSTTSCEEREKRPGAKICTFPQERSTPISSML